MSADIPREWRAFLRELDGFLDENVALHCVGGFAVVAAYGLPRSTNDLDYFSLEPYSRIADLEQIAGQGSALARKHRMFVHRAAVASVPERYDERLIEPFPYFKKLRLLVLDPYDLALSKLTRNAARDREDVKYLAKKCFLEARVLRDRYTEELRSILVGPAEQHDQTLEFWVEAYFS